MDFGIVLMTRGPSATAEGFARLAQRAEALGFRWAAVNDHLVVPAAVGSRYPYTDSGQWPGAQARVCLDVLGVLAFLAAKTETLRLLTSVLVVPMRAPVLAAKQMATIDVLSGGRLTLGIGAGWLEEEFRAVGAPPFAERGKATDEYIEIFRKLWRDAAPEHHGAYADFQNIHTDPRPVQPGGVPIWVGGESGAALKRAARLGDGWYPVPANPARPLDSPERYAAAVDEVRGLTAAAGRDPAGLALGMMCTWPVSEQPAALADGRRRPFSGPLDAIAGDLDAYGRAGLEHMMLGFAGGSLAEIEERMGWFAERVMPLAAK